MEEKKEEEEEDNDARKEGEGKEGDNRKLGARHVGGDGTQGEVEGEMWVNTIILHCKCV